MIKFGSNRLGSSALSVNILGSSRLFCGRKAVEIANDAKYPVLLKSAFGGGGRGIRLAKDEKELRQEFEMASAESKAAFGKAALFVEKFLEKIRHI